MILVGLAPVELAIFLLVDGFWTQFLLVLAVAVPVAIGLGVWVGGADSHSGVEGDGSHRESLITQGARIVVPETVMMELLSGTTDEVAAARRLRKLESFEVAPLEPIVDSLAAARLQRESRRGGERVRRLGDCLIAAVAIRLGVAVLHRDKGFEVLRRHCGLNTVSLLES